MRFQRSQIAMLLVVLATTLDVAIASRGDATGFRIPSSSNQLIVAIAPDWNSNTVRLQRYARASSKKKWAPVGESFPGRLGKNGLAWGRGINPTTPLPNGVAEKHEGDKRSPAGAFTLGTVYGYASDVPRNPKTDYLQVTPSDLMVEDPTSPLYNTHVRLDHLPETDWEKSQVMQLSNPAHELKIFVNHNVSPAPIPGLGSAILLHIWRRDGAGLTTGCTAMERAHMFEMVKWLDPTKEPLFVLLPRSMYADVHTAWGLPAGALDIAPAPTTVAGSTTTPKSASPVAPSTRVEVAGRPVTVAPEPPSTRKVVSKRPPRTA